MKLQHYDKLDPQTPEGKYVRKMGDALGKLSDMFAEALVDAGENYSKAEQKNNASEGVRYELRADKNIEEQNITNGTNAINWLIEQAKQSDNPQELVWQNAMFRSDIGQIDFVWGTPGVGEKFKKGYGISHIIAKHGIDTVYKVVDVIAKGTEYDKQGNNQTEPSQYRLRLYHNGYTAVLSKDETINHWLLTAWQKEETAESDTAEVNDSVGSTAVTPTLTRRNGVNTAVSNNTLSQPDAKINPSAEKLSPRTPQNAEIDEKELEAINKSGLSEEECR